jgi:hypothetical protein
MPGNPAIAERPADVPCYVPMEAMTVKGFALAPTIPSRVEKLVRRTLLRQRNPDCTLVKQVRRYRHAPVDGLGSLTVDTPARRHNLYYRADTSDEDVIRQIFAGGEYDLAMLRRFAEIRDFVERRHRVDCAR